MTDPAQSAPSAEQLANAEHDRLFPPRGQDESANDFLIRALTEHSNSHMDWVTWYEKHPETQRTLDDGHTLEYQKRCVWRYNEVFSAFKELNEAAALRTAQLERERSELERECENRLNAVNTYVRLLSKEVGLRQAAETRAETAESALAEALEELWDVKNGLMGLRDSESLTPTKEEWIAAKRAELLTVAAQTPQQK